ncbi:STAS domain-containing protein [Saprospira sp. CCB-QB6]|uniref:STAS domain-containing protein n=1 Tax=Saprospira sp. CCB-QB6 TaxID=3023936 RepID=UPI00234B9875|nr:STAS domain-containing protein [Saprospira sp. CCB-QB6]WCL81304.1 STAS domain-containing protein [Saprospira sp. CCB-QB6]
MEKHKTHSAALYRQLFFHTEEESKLINSASQNIPQEGIDWAFEEIVNWMENGPYQRSFNEMMVEATRQGKVPIWRDMASGNFNDDYVQQQTEARWVFLRSGVSLEAFTAMIAKFHELVFQTFMNYNTPTPELVRALKGFSQIDLSIVSEVYRQKAINDLEEQNEALKQLSTPIAQIWQGILLLPLVGFIDSKRAKDVMEAMLEEIAKSQAKFFILDISGVAIVDTAVANHLIKMTKAARLMGSECMISGVSGPIAQTIVELGIAIDEIRTTGSMRDALRLAIQEGGTAIV